MRGPLEPLGAWPAAMAATNVTAESASAALPALPLTNSTRPSIQRRIDSMSSATGSRRNRSSMATGRG